MSTAQKFKVIHHWGPPRQMREEAVIKLYASDTDHSIPIWLAGAAVGFGTGALLTMLLLT